ncbi:MAG TPA: CapA family protein [Clostridiaceae bacterium]|nr:CapA family protein [Clostridiaceae bacterium]
MSRKNNTISVAIAGDICMRDLTEVMDAEFSKNALKEVQPILDKADVRLINLENAIIDGGTAIHKSGPPLKGSPKNLVFLKEGRFDCAILANNHVGDYGEEGVYSTLEALDKEGIAHVGAGRNLDESYLPWYYEANGCKLAVIAVCENEFGIAEADKAGTAGFDIYRVFHAIKNAKVNADFVLVVMHGGNEYNPVPSPRVVSRYRMFVDFGADAVVGMHPHCMQGFETYNNAPIVYSTGNFLFSKSNVDDDKNPWYYGYLPFITFEKGKLPVLEVFPYRFNVECTLISPFTGKEKEIMLSYLAEISKPLKDEELLKKFFMGWCIISGIPHANRMMFKPEYVDEPEFPTGHPLLAIRNMYTCEAHNELMTVFFKMLADGKLDIGRSMVDEIKRLQKMPI